METMLNQQKAVNIIITEMFSTTNSGVEAPITKVKRLRKKSVAFGFSTLVKNPILKAFKRLISEECCSAARSSLDPLALMEPIPM